jgi:hypothetical protein
MTNRRDGASHEMTLGLTRRRVAFLVVFAGLVCAGVAYAAIPDAGTTVYHACLLKNVGTIRIIDPAITPPTSLLQHCAALETEITFNQRGIQGEQGVTGPAGPSVMSVALAKGDSNCPAGGSRFTVGTTVTYACNGADATAGTLSCPSGFVFYSPTMCVQSDDQDGFTLAEAANHCRLLGAQLPAYAELLAIAESGVTLGASLQQDWTASSVGDGTSIYINNATPPDMDGVRANSATGFARCIAPAR